MLDLRNPGESEILQSETRGKSGTKKANLTKISPFTLMMFKMFGIALSALVVVLLYKNFAPVDDIKGNLNNTKGKVEKSETENPEVLNEGVDVSLEDSTTDISSDSTPSEGDDKSSEDPSTDTETSSSKKPTNSNLSTEYVTFRLEKPIIEAGASLLLTSSVAKPGITMTFNVSKGDKNLTFRASTNGSGVAVVRVPGENFIESGTYQVSIQSSDSVLSKGIKPLLVKPGKTSADATVIETEVGSLPIGGSSEFLVKVYDKYQNPIPNATLKVLKDTNDTLSTPSIVTNPLGEATFSLKKGTAQDVTLQIMDMTSGVILEELVIEGVAPSSQNLNAGGSLLGSFFHSQSASAQTNTNFFSFSGIQSQVAVNSPLSFTLSLMDTDNAVVTGYTGTVKFTSDESGAELPNDYTFNTSDNGTKFFIGDMSFTAPGTYIITATDTSNSAITGLVQVTVGGDAPDTDTGNADVTILSPLSGNTLNSNTINIAGTADSGGAVNIFDGVIQIGSTQAGPNGDFFFTTKALTDGQHKLRAESNGSKSEEVSVIVDTNSPEVDKITITPKTVPPGTNINVEVQTEPALTRVKFIADGRQIDLVENTSKPGVYSGAFRAPATAGLFKVDIELSDTLNNPSLYEGVETFTVRLGDPLNPGVDDVVTTPGDPLTDPIANIPKTDDTGPREMILMVFVLAGIVVFVGERLKARGKNQ